MNEESDEEERVEEKEKKEEEEEEEKKKGEMGVENEIPLLFNFLLVEIVLLLVLLVSMSGFPSIPFLRSSKSQ